MADTLAPFWCRCPWPGSMSESYCHRGGSVTAGNIISRRQARRTAGLSRPLFGSLAIAEKPDHGSVYQRASYAPLRVWDTGGLSGPRAATTGFSFRFIVTDTKLAERPRQEAGQAAAYARGKI